MPDRPEGPIHVHVKATTIGFRNAHDTRLPPLLSLAASQATGDRQPRWSVTTAATQHCWRRWCTSRPASRRAPARPVSCSVHVGSAVDVVGGAGDVAGLLESAELAARIMGEAPARPV